MHRGANVFEGPRLACEVPQPQQEPLGAPLFGHREFVLVMWKGVRSQPLVVFTSISGYDLRMRSSAMSYPAPSPSSSDTHLTCFAKSKRSASSPTTPAADSRAIVRDGA